VLSAVYMGLLFLLCASSMYAILKLHQFSTGTLQNLATDMRIFDYQKGLTDSMLSQRRYEQKFVITKDATLYHQFVTERESFSRHLALTDQLANTPFKKEALRNIRALYQHYEALVDSEVGHLKEGRPYSGNWYKAEKTLASDAVLKELQNLEDYTHADATRVMGDVSQARTSVREVAIYSFLVTFCFAIGISFLITRSITNPLMSLVKRTREISTGVFRGDLDISSPSEISELANAFNTMCNKLKAAERMKSDFFSMISHELRTPLTTIKEGANLLLERVGGPISEKQETLLSILSSETNRLIDLVNLILDLSKMEAGMMTYTFEEGSIEFLVEQATMEIAPYVEAKKIELKKRIDGNLPLCRLDGERILIALRNLIGNAVKFTPEGGQITISTNHADGEVTVSVTDTGLGIPLETLPTVFDKFRGENQRQGTGLGLAIVKHTITAHGGRVWAESKPGEGSTFTFALPC
jgi:two-component system, NtrC family, sensor histidine kinase GlrK